MTTSVKFLSPSKLRQLQVSGQVAAVCYRMRNSKVEFLLVRTRGGRWTFPKGGSEPGLTHAQAAALEAFEEAGVHGRMEDVSFSRYLLRAEKKSGIGGLAVHAYLCEVSRQVEPEESKRNPTWFSPSNAKRKLREGRTSKDGAEFARVVDQAMARVIGSLTKFVRLEQAAMKGDALQKVAFEASEIKHAALRQDRVDPALNAYLHKMVQRNLYPELPSQFSLRQAKGLLQSCNSAPRLAHVFEIDKPPEPENRAKISTRTNRRKPPTIG